MVFKLFLLQCRLIKNVQNMREKENKDLVIEAIESLIKLKIIIPFTSKKQLDYIST